MAKQKQKNKKTTPTAPEEPKHILAELVVNSNTDTVWIIYNLSRTGLLEQYEQEILDYGIKEIEPTITIKEFEKIINGK